MMFLKAILVKCSECTVISLLQPFGNLVTVIKQHYWGGRGLVASVGGIPAQSSPTNWPLFYEITPKWPKITHILP